MNAVLDQGRAAPAPSLEVRLLSPEELEGIDGGNVVVAGCLIALGGAGVAVAGICIGVLVYLYTS